MITNPEIERLIVKYLPELKNPDDLIPQVCERTGLDWNGAKKLIASVHARHQGNIAGRRYRIGLCYAIPTMIAGAGLVMGMLLVIKDHANDIGNTGIPKPRVWMALVFGMMMFLGGLTGILVKPKK